jgi:hypothetical protein
MGKRPSKKAEPEKDTASKPADDVFQNDFSNDKDSAAAAKQQQELAQNPIAGVPPAPEPVLARASCMTTG